MLISQWYTSTNILFSLSPWELTMATILVDLSKEPILNSFVLVHQHGAHDVTILVISQFRPQSVYG